jgi:hypothetical protein
MIEEQKRNYKLNERDGHVEKNKERAGSNSKDERERERKEYYGS